MAGVLTAAGKLGGQVAEGHKVAEFGMGAGAFLQAFGGCFDGVSLELYGVDSSVSAVAVASARLPHGQHTTTLTSNCHSLAQPIGTYHFISDSAFKQQLL